MSFSVFDPITQQVFKFDDRNSADNKVEEIKSIISINEDYRFTIVKEISDGDNSIWVSADVNNDPEDCVYHVFNQHIGRHEKCNSLSSAISKKQEIKNEYLASLNFVTEEIPQSLLDELDKLP